VIAAGKKEPSKLFFFASHSIAVRLMKYQRAGLLGDRGFKRRQNVELGSFNTDLALNFLLKYHIT
jgi:hypothetical protein